MKILTLYTLCIIALILQSCGDSTSPTSDANQTVKIGTQVWTSKNLDISTYRNGDPIRYASTPAEWQDASTKGEGAWCYYNNDPTQGARYGKIYNWYAVTDPRGLAPQGWHIPSDAEWTTLGIALGGNPVAGGKMKEPGTLNWTTPNTGATNISGFAGLPGGYRFGDGAFGDVGNDGVWWGSTEGNTPTAWYRALSYVSGGVSRYGNGEQNGFSVRCLRD